MITKNINNEQFKQAVRVSFEGDSEIYGLYNPSITVQSVDDIVNDISSRIQSDVRKIDVKGVYDKNNLVGYYAYSDDTLVSFGLSIEYRKRKYLKELWHLIRRDLRGAFQCHLFTRNIRGVKWLGKNGMKIFKQDNLITHLIY